jgi:hypothetical protein
MGRLIIVVLACIIMAASATTLDQSRLSCIEAASPASRFSKLYNNVNERVVTSFNVHTLEVRVGLRSAQHIAL